MVALRIGEMSEVWDMSNVLRVRNLSLEITAARDTLTVVDKVSFRVPEGKTVALVGESGAGKSMIAQTVMGILPKIARVTEGEVLFFDPESEGHFADLVKLPPNGLDFRNIRGGRISMVFQEPMTALSPVHTIGNQIEENLLVHAKLGDRLVTMLETVQQVDRQTAKDISLDILHLVGFPDPAGAYSAYPFELSGGLRQRAVIAMALICRPALLVADEPTTALDVTIQAQILKLVKDLQSELQMAMLLITHDLGVVANVADEVVVLKDGKVMEQGLVSDIFLDPRHPYLKALLNAIPSTDPDQSERLIPLRSIEADTSQLLEARAPADEATRAAGPMLEFKKVSKEFTKRNARNWFGGGEKAKVYAVQDVSLTVPVGSCVALVGESGSGKSTLAKMALNAFPADGGEIIFNDRGQLRDVGKMSRSEMFEYRCRAQMIFQDPFASLNPRMTVKDIITEPLTIHKVGTEDQRLAQARALLKLVGLSDTALNRYPHSFSGGQRQRIGIARALALMPDLLICDEPVSALDVSVQAQVLNLLKDLQKKLGLTMFFISHNLAVVNHVADTVAVMCRGRVIEAAPRLKLFQGAVHPYTKALLSAVPEPDLGRKLDFAALMEGRNSDPTIWPEPFKLTPETEPVWMAVSQDHHVLVLEHISLDQLVA